MFNNDKLTLKSMVLCALFTALIAIGAFITIPLPYVPITLQTLFVLLAALILGPKLSTISVGLYIFIGLIGIPIFTKGGGLHYVFQPTFGYLIGFLIASYIIGRIAGKDRDVSYLRLSVSTVVGIIVIDVIGMIYLYFVMKFHIGKDIGLNVLLTSYFLMFIPGDLIKCFVAVISAKRLRKILR